MEKYTIIHQASTPTMVGVLYTTEYERVETDDLKRYVRENDLDVQIIFRGWPEIDGHEWGDATLKVL